MGRAVKDRLGGAEPSDVFLAGGARHFYVLCGQMDRTLRRKKTHHGGYATGCGSGGNDGHSRQCVDDLRVGLFDWGRQLFCLFPRHQCGAAVVPAHQGHSVRRCQYDFRHCCRHYGASLPRVARQLRCRSHGTCRGLPDAGAWPPRLATDCLAAARNSAAGHQGRGDK